MCRPEPLRCINTFLLDRKRDFCRKWVPIRQWICPPFGAGARNEAKAEHIIIIIIIIVDERNNDDGTLSNLKIDFFACAGIENIK